MLTNIIDRAFKAINLAQFKEENSPDRIIKNFNIKPTFSELNVLRCLIKTPFQDYKLPDFLTWITPMLKIVDEVQRNCYKIYHPYCYITVRHGNVRSVTDDEWHVDGFTMQTTHLPEQNYFWSNVNHTEYVHQSINFPSHFDPLKFNIHSYIQDVIKDYGYNQLETMEGIYCVDPYVIHRRPPKTHGTKRTFIRISYCPTLICDDMNTPNPLIEMPKFNREGVRDFRDKLFKY